MSKPEAVAPASWGAELDWYEETRLSPAVRVGNLLFVAGCTGAEAHEQGPKAMIRQAYMSVLDVLEAAGADWGNVVAITSYHVDMSKRIDDAVEVHREFVKSKPFPAWTAVGVTELYEPEAIIEISVIAHLS